MTYSIEKIERRRSRRIPQSVPLLVRFLDSPFPIGENHQTVEVSHHGCVIYALHPLPRGTKLRLDNLQSHHTMTARVVHSDPIGTRTYITVWAIAMELDQPGDVWMVNPPPGWSKTPGEQWNKENLSSGPFRGADQESRW